MIHCVRNHSGGKTSVTTADFVIGSTKVRAPSDKIHVQIWVRSIDVAMRARKTHANTK